MIDKRDKIILHLTNNGKPDLKAQAEYTEGKMGESEKEMWFALTEQERLEVRRKAQQELIKKIEKLVNKRIKELKTDANNNKEAETKIVLKNCANELKYFWKDVKKEVEK